MCQICANLIGTSWHLVAQHATSVSASIIKIRVNKLHPCFGSRGSEVRVLSPRPFKTIGYGLGRSPFFVVGNSVGNKWRANRIKSSLPVIEQPFFPKRILVMFEILLTYIWYLAILPCRNQTVMVMCLNNILISCYSIRWPEIKG